MWPWVSGNSWPSTATQCSPTTLLTRFGPLWLLPFPQAEQHPEGETNSRRCGDTVEYDMAASCKPFQNRPTTHALKNGKISGNPAYNLGYHTLQEVTLTCKCYTFPTVNSVLDIFDQPSYFGHANFLAAGVGLPLMAEWGCNSHPNFFQKVSHNNKSKISSFLFECTE
jgi:hypothetical protein